ncbi:MAG: hypothetical protein JF567_04770 [Xanthomonadales bacterium]|nr:hypothetical protein [Xanthomonadales bacterium]
MTERLASTDPQVAAARHRARRTAWMVAAVALAIYLAFFVLGMTGHVR